MFIFVNNNQQNQKEMRTKLNVFALVAFTGLLFLWGCEKEIVMPTVTTAEVTNITQSGATCGGEVTFDGNAGVTRGVCWSATENPTIADNHTTDGSGEGAFTSTITGLAPTVKYYVRAYATNSAGTAYGIQREFTTPI
jgi:hypothetical protein